MIFDTGELTLVAGREAEGEDCMACVCIHRHERGEVKRVHNEELYVYHSGAYITSSGGKGGHLCSRLSLRQELGFLIPPPPLRNMSL